MFLIASTTERRNRAGQYDRASRASMTPSVRTIAVGKETYARASEWTVST